MHAFHSAGAIISPTFTLLRKNFWLITKIVSIIFVPLEMFRELKFGTSQPDWRATIGFFLAEGFLRALVAPSLIFALLTVMRTGSAPRLGDIYRRGVGRLGKLILVTLLAALVQLIGYLCLIIPGVLLSIGFEVTYPLAVLENSGPVATLKRSYELTRSYRGNIFLTRLVLWMLLMVAGIPATALLMILAAYGVDYWPLRAGVRFTTDVINQSSTIVSLVIYLSISRQWPASSDISENEVLPPPRAGVLVDSSNR